MVDRLLNAWLTLGTNLWFLPFLMGAALAETMRRAKERTIHRDAAARVIAPISDDRGLIEAAFNQIRQAGADYPAILIHLLETLGGLAPHVRTAQQRRALLEQAEAVAAAARRTVPEALDLEAIEQRRRAAADALAAPE